MLSTSLMLFVYAFVFLAFVCGLLLWRRHRRKTRLPFPPDLCLLRGPGETQHRILVKLAEDMVIKLLAAFAIPLAVFGALIWMVQNLDGTWQLVGLIVALAILLTTTFLVARFIASRLQESIDRYLGFFGERVVAEALDPLKAHGYRVFHDVPGEQGGARFNIDHVVAGPGGVFAIETKTRRKGRARGGYAAHEIIYDGTVLAYPWGEDRHGLDQAKRQAEWLEAALARVLGRRPQVQAILTFPGWMIIRRGHGPVSVLNPKEIPSVVESRAVPVLARDQLELICRELDARCRDVTY